MSEERDDEILGRALARAIETLDPNETPYERSRLAVRPLRRGLPLWQFAGVAAALLLAVVLASWSVRPATSTPAAASVAPTPTQAATVPAVATAVPQVDPGSPMWAYFTREGLPPIGAFITAHGLTDTPDHRVLTRLSALESAARSDTPAGTTSPLSQAGAYAGGSSLSIGVRITGDLATAELDAPNGWGIRDPYTRQLVQQIVYTATEESGVRRVQLTGRGGQPLKIDQLVFDKALARDDVSGYSFTASLGTTHFPGAVVPSTLSTSYSVDDVAPGLARFVITFAPTAPSPAAAPPEFTASLMPTNMSTGQFELEVSVPGGSDGTTQAMAVDRSPLRWIAVGKSNTATIQTYRLGLDDLRPWRVYTRSDPWRIVFEIGGPPQAVSDRIAVTAPVANTTIDSRISRTVSFAGSARTFEANVVWRLKDSSGKQVASGHTTASLGTSALWGTFSAQITLPAVSGNVTLEVYEVSPKDGTEQGLVAVPLIVR